MTDLRSGLALMLALVAAAACGSGEIGSGTGGTGGGQGASTASGQGGVSNAGGGPVACKKGETHQCYTGPSGTLDVGICKAGIQDCNDNGVFGSCHDQVLPKTENCNKRGDEDCDGNGCSDAIWDKVGGDAQAQAITALAIDGDGNTFAAGSFQGTLNLGKGATTAGGGGDLFIAKFDPTGKALWQQNFAVAGGGAAVTGLALTSNGSVAASFTSTGGSIALPSATIDGGNIGVAALFDGDGNEKWAKPIKSMTMTAETAGVAVGKLDAVIIGGDFDGQLACSAGGCPTSKGGKDIFLRAYDPGTGAEQWTQGYGGANDENVSSVSTNPDGTIFVGGNFMMSTSLNGKTLNSQGDADVFVLRTNASGSANLAVALGTAGFDTGVVTGRGDGSFVVGGQTSDEITIGMVSTGMGTKGAYVFAFNSDGTPDWARGFGTTGVSAIVSISSDFDGNVWAAGTVSSGKSDFGGGIIDNTMTGDDVALSSLSQDGNFRWAKAFGGAGSQTAPRVAVNGRSTSAFSVVYQGTLNFGLTSHTSSNASGAAGDIALTSFQP